MGHKKNKSMDFCKSGKSPLTNENDFGLQNKNEKRGGNAVPLYLQCTFM